ncbi:MAG: hypothetical protein AMJ78_10780 [Omnitrophica WOR_2 bacterium SM23_29]|nr:MAG: hypothetical protein AMJ78_10780 [Omnitrophica WOR_2 bacterium SM23_29]
MPSASRTIGFFKVTKSLLTNFCVLMLRESPGPTATESTLSANFKISGKAFSLNVWLRVSVSGFVITSVNFLAKMGFKLLQIPSVTSPLPDKSAAWAHNAAAPVIPTEPAITNTCP